MRAPLPAAAARRHASSIVCGSQRASERQTVHSFPCRAAQWSVGCGWGWRLGSALGVSASSRSPDDGWANTATARTDGFKVGHPLLSGWEESLLVLPLPSSLRLLAGRDPRETEGPSSTGFAKRSQRTARQHKTNCHARRCRAGASDGRAS